MKAKTWIGIGIVLGVAVVAGAAYLIPGLLTGKSSGLPGFLSFLSGQSIEGGGGITIVPASELPQGNSAQTGTVTNLQNNSLYVTPKRGGSPVEVVVTNTTKVLKDVTRDNLPRPDPGTEMQVQQKLESSSVSQIAVDSAVEVWGDRRGDRIIAEVVVFLGSNMMKK